MTDAAHRSPGRVIDQRYRVLETLAPATGDYLVHDARDDVRCRLKLAREGLSELEQQRFFDLAKILSAFEDPNCDRVVGFGTSDSGTPYAAAAWIDGRPLSALTGHPFEPIRAAVLALAILRGLRYAHRHDLVHRALEPSVVVVPEDEARAYVTSFWGASILRGDESGQSVANFDLGSTTYLSPEQGMGEAADPQSDLYAAGIILFELLSGAPPFADPDPLKVLELHMAAAFPALPASIPVALAQIVQRLTAKRRGDRYLQAREAISELEGFVAAARQPSGAVPVAASASQSGASALGAPPPLPSGPVVTVSTAGIERTDHGLPPLRTAVVPVDRPSPTPSAVPRPQLGEVQPGRRGLVMALTASVALLVVVGAALAFFLWSQDRPAATDNPVAVANPVPSASAPPASSPRTPTLQMLAAVNQRDADLFLGYARRHAVLQRLANTGQSDKVDTRLQLALDLLQAADSGTPCATFAAALTQIEAARDSYFAPTLATATVPTTEPAAGDSSCAGLEQRLTTLRGPPDSESVQERLPATRDPSPGEATPAPPDTAVQPMPAARPSTGSATSARARDARKRKRKRKAPPKPTVPKPQATKTDSEAAPPPVIKKLDGGVRKFDE